MERPHLSSGKVNGKWDSKNFSFEENQDHSCGTSWPAKQYYRCTFCNRQFRSAQALGGHMNVHRKDRASLRSLLPSAVSQCPDNSNPNPNFTSSASASTGYKGKKRIRNFLGFGGSKGSAQKDEPKVLKKEDIISLDLEIGSLKDPKEDLDLELRLGCFN
ncbi:hypothetical protein SLA2020_445310 [Shorea laevis]